MMSTRSMGEGIYILNGLIYYCNMFSHILILIFNDAFCSYIFVYMVALLGQTNGPNGLKLLEGTHVNPRDNIFFVKN